MKLSNVVITWMDGESETYTDTQASVRDGVLHVYQYQPLTGNIVFEWHFPIANIRYWAPEKNGKHHGTLSGRKPNPGPDEDTS